MANEPFLLKLNHKDVQVRKTTYFILLFIPFILFVFFCINNNNTTLNSSQNELTGDVEQDYYGQYGTHYLDSSERIRELSREIYKLLEGETAFCEAEWDDEMFWENLGPFESNTHYQMNQGRIESISVNPSDYNDILISGLNGGAWRSRDGGKIWYNTTDDEQFSVVGFHEIVRHPKNPRIIYAATGVGIPRWNHGKREHGMGVVISQDGGDSWKLTGLAPDYGSWNSGITAIRVDPRSTLDSTIIYAVNQSVVFRYTGEYSAKTEWQKYFIDGRYFNGPGIYGNVGFHDLEIDRYGNVFACNYTGVYRSAVNRDSFVKVDLPIPDFIPESCTLDKNSVTNPVRTIFDLEINASGHIGVLANHTFKREIRGKCRMKTGPYVYISSRDGGKNWLEPQKLSTFGYAVPNLSLHKYDADVFYFEDGSRHVRRSVDGGKTNERIPNGRNHVDVRTFSMMGGKPGDKLGIYDQLYVGNDGGISKLDSGKWKDITGWGLSISNYFGLALTEEDPDYIWLGAQDGSANYYDHGTWYTTSPGGDNGDCLINPLNKDEVHQSSNGTLQVGKVGNNNWRGRTVKTVSSGFRLFPLLRHPLNPNEIFAGGTNVIALVHDQVGSTDIQAPHPPKQVNAMAMSTSDSNRLYYVISGFFWDKKNKASEDHNVGGVFMAQRDSNGRWSTVDITGNIKTKCIGENNCGLHHPLTGVTTSPSDPEKVWVSMDGFKSGSKIFYSQDAGASWENISTCLPNVPVTCLVHDGSADNGIYAGTDFGVFYKNDEMSNWIHYAEGCPQSMISDMEINQGSQELYIATMGRGLWKVDLVQ